MILHRDGDVHENRRWSSYSAVDCGVSSRGSKRNSVIKVRRDSAIGFFLS